MLNSNQTQSQIAFSLAQDAVDAHSLAHEVISDLSAIFEAIQHLSISGRSDEHVISKLCGVGYSFATYRLGLIERNLEISKKALAEIEGANHV